VCLQQTEPIQFRQFHVTELNRCERGSMILEAVGTSCENHTFSITELIEACKAVQELHLSCSQ